MEKQIGVKDNSEYPDYEEIDILENQQEGLYKVLRFIEQ